FEQQGLDHLLALDEAASLRRQFLNGCCGHVG
ncbi:MAG: hypothetical protein ACI9S9_002950, partial [Planctomycetota bacterium]